jgi:hypothetical protein
MPRISLPDRRGFWWRRILRHRENRLPRSIADIAIGCPPTHVALCIAACIDRSARCADDRAAQIFTNSIRALGRDICRAQKLFAPHCESIGVAELQQLPTILRADSISSHE